MSNLIVRECDRGERRVTVYSDSYGHTLQHFLKLFEVAREDFPDLNPQDVEIVQFGGDRVSRIFGIQFPSGGDTIPARYSRRNLEPIVS